MIREEIQFVSCILVVGDPGILPRKKNENQECRRSHIRSFCKVFKVSNLPELCLFAAVSGESL